MQQAIAGGSELMQRRVHDDVVAADVQQREIEPQTGVETRGTWAIAPATCVPETATLTMSASG
ncbi:MAG TPA: hypothetical protein VGP77_13725 [Vicinamibacterales bacterium]|nr:hypothetical protein [Vicinamibacterales bacterium]